MNSQKKKPPSLKATSILKSNIIRSQEPRHETRRWKSCGFSTKYIQQYHTDRTERLKPHDMILLTMEEKAIRLPPDDYVLPDKSIKKIQKNDNKNGI